jgi:hypothetical protein
MVKGRERRAPRLPNSQQLDSEAMIMGRIQTKASVICKATGNLRAVQILLSHTKIENTGDALASRLKKR